MRFPEGFLFGTATSALQVEGGNVNNDWWEWEHRPGSPVAEVVGDACDHYHRYPEDIALMAELGLNAYRFTIEWARVEPAPGQISYAALAHYRRMLQTCHDHGITPMVSLHHFTLPRWVAEAGGWTSPTTAVRFQAYARLIAIELGDLFSHVFTIVEANMVADNAYLYGIFPPGHVGDAESHQRAQLVLARAHQTARAAIKAERPELLVGSSLSMLAPVIAAGGEDAAHRHLHATLGPYLQVAAEDDFLGVQCYSTQHYGPDGPTESPLGVERTQMWWEFAPEAAADMCRVLATVVPHLPLMISENGIATYDDTRRVEFVQRALAAVSAATQDGVDIRGYLHWSFLDNYEWNLGFRCTFGLVGYDPRTFERTVKPSARAYSEIVRAATSS